MVRGGRDDLVPRARVVATFTYWTVEGCVTRYLTHDDLVAFVHDMALQGTGLLQKVTTATGRGFA